MMKPVPIDVLPDSFESAPPPPESPTTPRTWTTAGRARSAMSGSPALPAVAAPLCRGWLVQSDPSRSPRAGAAASPMRAVTAKEVEARSGARIRARELTLLEARVALGGAEEPAELALLRRGEVVLGGSSVRGERRELGLPVLLLVA